MPSALAPFMIPPVIDLGDQRSSISLPLHRERDSGINVSGHLILCLFVGDLYVGPPIFILILPSTLPTMPGRKVGRGPSKPSKTKSPKPVKVKVKAPKPVKVKPGKATPTPRFVAPPLLPPKTAPRPPPKTPLTLPQRVQIGPRKSASSPWLRTTSSSHSIKPSSKPSFLSNPSAHYPPTPNKFPASPHTSKLKPSKSVPNFAGMGD
jgi:hypothetical protein